MTANRQRPHRAFRRGASEAEGREALSRLRQSRTQCAALSCRAVAPGRGRREPARRDDLVLQRLSRHGRASGRRRGRRRRPWPAWRGRRRHAQHFRHAQPHRRVGARPRRPPSQGGGAGLHLRLDLQSRRHLDHRLAVAGLSDPVGCAQPQFDDRGRAPFRLRAASCSATTTSPIWKSCLRLNRAVARNSSCSKASIRWTATSRPSLRSPISLRDITR